MTNNNHVFKSDVEGRLKDVLEWLEEGGMSNELTRDLYEQKEELNKWLAVANQCTNIEKDWYTGTRTDGRINGDDHSEVSTSIDMTCCYACCEAYNEYERYQARMNRGMTGRTCYSPSWGKLVNAQGRVVHKNNTPVKIVHYEGRSMAESLDSDEMRINNEWLSDEADY